MGEKSAAPDWGRRYEVDEKLWTELLPGLWLGGTADDDTVADARDHVRKFSGLFDIYDGRITREHFDAVVTLYAWAQPVDWDVEELRYGFYDAGLSSESEDIVLEAADWAGARWKAGKRVLIRCQAGLNRSSLVAALVLMRHAEKTAWEAITLIRSLRSRYCLHNAAFVAFLEGRDE